MTIFLSLFGILLLIYGFLVLRILGCGNWFHFSGLIGGILFLLLASFWNRIKKHRVFHRVIKLLLIIFSSITLFTMSFLFIFGNQKAKPDAKWVIVLGAKVNESGPSLEFSRRIHLCSEYARKNPGSIVIGTGGKGKNEVKAESLATKELLEKLGISNPILTEEKSTSTKENMKYAAEIILKEKGNLSEPVVIISSKFHLYRSYLLAKNAGFTNFSLQGSVGLKILEPFYYFREFAALIAEIAK